MSEASARSTRPCNSLFRKCESHWTTWKSSTRKQKRRTSASIILLAWRLLVLPLYYHHDLAVTIPDIQCWCFPARTPYGYLWYLVNYPLSFNYPLELTIVDFVVQLGITNRSVFWPTFVSSYILYTAAPYDMSIVWLSLLGLLNPILLVIAPLSKLPDTAAAWTFIFHKTTDANDIEYYLITAFPWLWITISWLKNKSSNKS